MNAIKAPSRWKDSDVRFRRDRLKNEIINIFSLSIEDRLKLIQSQNPSIKRADETKEFSKEESETITQIAINYSLDNCFQTNKF